MNRYISSFFITFFIYSTIGAVLFFIPSYKKSEAKEKRVINIQLLKETKKTTVSKETLAVNSIQKLALKKVKNTNNQNSIQPIIKKTTKKFNNKFKTQVTQKKILKVKATKKKPTKVYKKRLVKQRVKAKKHIKKVYKKNQPKKSQKIVKKNYTKSPKIRVKVKKPTAKKVANKHSKKSLKTKTKKVAKTTKVKKKSSKVVKSKYIKKVKKRKVARKAKSKIKRYVNYNLLSQLQRRINQNKSYPRVAKRLGLSGDVDISFTIMPDGNVANIKVNGSRVFQSSAIKAVENSFPIDVRGAPFSLPKRINMKMKFVLR